MQSFDPNKKETSLRLEAESWDTLNLETALEGDIPVIDLSNYFATPGDQSLQKVADQLLHACTEAGFYSLTGHGISEKLINDVFAEAKKFHALPLATKMALQMDHPDRSAAGVGYMPFQNRKLPARKKGNANEALIIKRELGPRNVTLDKNPWPEEQDLPGFRQKTELYAEAIEQLAMKLLPIYARALGMEDNFFDPGFKSPLYRLRMTKYPPIEQNADDEFGIAPHVDSTFITILAQDSEGLVIYSEQRQCWIKAPVIKDAFIVNTGELLKQWSNDYFISVKHFANNNTGEQPRYSVPFFFNASADYPMECIPSCCSDTRPAKYPPVSYLESQSVVQGE
jgi:isopenicillin N synthase-like dioxygenase